MKKLLILPILGSLLLANNCVDDLKGTFIEKGLKNQNNTIKCKKLNSNIELINIIDKATQKEVRFYVLNVKGKKYILIGQLINAKGKVLNNAIIDKNIVKNGIAFTFGNGKKDLYVVTDPQCPFCKNFFTKNYDELVKKYKVHVIFMPLTEIHPQAKKMVEYVLAGNNNKERLNRFLELEKGDYKNFKKFDFSKLNSIKQIRIKKEMKNNMKASKELKAKGTPSIYDENLTPLN